ncbi:hypothetical protein ACIRON_01605 [Nocardioides sp. NPDC101246]|uniref:hypothetical protein n=1 Tax=Nocardioides sp. NPDC101246 TaxID=3364336 RepID=UPI0037F678F8
MTLIAERAVTITDGLDHLRDLMTTYAKRAPVTSVAVLGNAPLGPSAARAQAIDESDLVIRVNSFVLDLPGEARVQGSRADVVLWNRITRTTRFTFDRYRERLYLLAEPMRFHGRPEVWPMSWPPDLGFVPIPNAEVLPRIGDELDIPWRAEKLAPTTGFTAAWLAVNLFPDSEIRLSGFSFIDNPGQREWNYQVGGTSPVGPEHRIEAEARVMTDWLKEERVSLWR